MTLTFTNSGSEVQLLSPKLSKEPPGDEGRRADGSKVKGSDVNFKAVCWACLKQNVIPGIPASVAEIVSGVFA